MSRPARIFRVDHLGLHSLRLTFSDGLVRELDLGPMLTGEAFDGLRDPSVFAQVAVDDLAGTIRWPGGIDLDPDVLHGDHEPASGRGPTVLASYRLKTAG